FGQGRAGSKSRPAAEHGRDRGATRSRWPASPLRAPRGLIMTKVPHVDIDGHPFARTTNPRLLRPRSRARRWACERASVRARSWPSRSTQEPHPVGAQMSGWRRTRPSTPRDFLRFSSIRFWYRTGYAIAKIAAAGGQVSRMGCQTGGLLLL